MTLRLDPTCIRPKLAARTIEASGTAMATTGTTALARETGLAREGPCQALSADGNPEFATVMKVTRALGLRLRSSAAYTHAVRRAEAIEFFASNLDGDWQQLAPGHGCRHA